MKTTLTAIAVSLMLTLPAYAADDSHAAHHPDQAAAPAAAQAQTQTVDPAATLKQMQANVTEMRGQLERIGKAKTPAERQKLLAEHMQTMRQNMMLGQAMMGGMGMAGSGMGMMGGGGMGMMGGAGMGMAGGGMGCPMMQGGGMGMMGADHGAMMDRMQQMEKRMDMMQMMMEQMTAKPQAAPAK